MSPFGRLASRPAAPIRLACLDMAGTTVRDEGVVNRAFLAAVQAVALPDDRLADAERIVRETMGQPKGVVFAMILGDGGPVREALAAFDHSVLADISSGLVGPLPGAADAMAELRANGVKVCLTTGFTADVQRAIVEHLGWDREVDLVLAPHDGVRGRPYPDLVLAAVLELGIDDVASVAVAGDTANDLWTGTRAGAGIVAGVLTGTHSPAELRRAPHTHLLDSVADLPAVAAGEAWERFSHRELAISGFNATWELIDAAERTEDDDREMLIRAAASRAHWGAAGGNAEQVATGDWQVAHVASLLGAGDVALRFAASALAAAEHEGWDGWRLASMHEGMARACAAVGDTEGRDRHITAALAALEREPDDEDRQLIAEQIASIG